MPTCSARTWQTALMRKLQRRPGLILSSWLTRLRRLCCALLSHDSSPNFGNSSNIESKFFLYHSRG